MFADDTNLFLTGRNLSDLEAKLNIELNKINTWFQVNLLSLNYSKTNYIIFHNSRNRHNLADVNLHINNFKLQRVNFTKFLGVIIDSKLNWKMHIDKINNKVSKSVGVICKLRHILPHDHVRNLYHTLVEPYFLYCILVWAGPVKTGKLDKLLRLQKKFVRLILFQPYGAHSKNLFSLLRIRTIYQIYTYRLAMYMFNAIVQKRQGPFRFQINSDIHSHDTRNGRRLHVLRARTRRRQSTVQFYGLKLWNSIPQGITKLAVTSAFRSRIKQYIGELFEFDELFSL